MNLLAIDTALEACSVAVARDGEPSVIASEMIGRGHAERLFAMIGAAMAEAGLAYSDLDRIAVTIGPGSFTGLRVGIAAARGLALVVGCPVVGIGTLAVLAAEARGKAGPVPVLATLDARRGEVYAQLFDGDGAPLGEAEADAPAAIAARLASQFAPGALIAGSGAALVAAELGEGADSRIVPVAATPDMASLVRLALEAPPPGASPRPLYVRAPDAKPQSAAAVQRR
ncbi:MAG: tRNA (adenosine(37)-N6)-threonylcarbamoyltransferase complex dimerization subunit type 1 TsaB [Bauldia sp.]|nr:tRNA (adenosine(37)-N6)-threonylcarbamoyltransferase complex dimerization subunit type 1 TsaB [Bauldia sp.]